MIGNQISLKKGLGGSIGELKLPYHHIHLTYDRGKVSALFRMESYCTSKSCIEGVGYKPIKVYK